MIIKSASLQNDVSQFVFPGKLRVFFGHQSVGRNILDGIRQNHPNAKIVAYDSQEKGARKYGIFHKSIGRNGDPYSKIDGFVECVQSAATPFDIALMKFCYADIDTMTDVNELFQYYQEAMNKLSRTLPGTRILHCTVPLRSIRLGIRSFLRLAFGRSVTAIQENIQREALSDLVRSDCLENSRLFDIAALESKSLSGSLCVPNYHAVRVPALDPYYSSDGGHLNGVGRRYIAEKFVQLINDTKQ